MLRVMNRWMLFCVRRRRLDLYGVARWLAIREVLVERKYRWAGASGMPVLIEVSPRW